MSKIILKLEEGRVPAKEARKIGKLKGPKGGPPGKSALGLVKNLNWTFHGSKRAIGTSPKGEDSACPKKDGDVIREYQAVHEENFISSWLR